MKSVYLSLIWLSRVCVSAAFATVLASSSTEKQSQIHVRWKGPRTSSSHLSSTTCQAKTSDVFCLDTIRKSLIRQEETIIFAMIERSQFAQNRIVYVPDGFPDLRCMDENDNIEECENSNGISLLDYMLIGTEALHAKVRRYTSPEEHSFFPSQLPAVRALSDLDFPELLSPTNEADQINFNDVLMKIYLNEIVPEIASEGDDEQHGSTVTCDVAVLQAISKRVHYGKFVAESKYQSDPEGYQKLIDADDAEGVMALLTNAAVEEKVLRRARLKAATYGREPLLSQMPPIEGVSDHKSEIVAAAAASAVVAAVEALNDEGEMRKGKVDPKTVEEIYRDFIIPLTKDIEVAYLYRRCGRDPPRNLDPSKLMEKYRNFFAH